MLFTDSLWSITGAALFITTTLTPNVQAHGASGFDRTVRRGHSHHHHHKPALFEQQEAAFTLEGNDTEDRTILEKRSGQCQFPYADGMVAVNPSGQNAGWAMSPDQPCLPGSYCPYSCAPGMLMAQWNPAATSYTYPLSMDGGLFCNSDGSLSKPFPDKPYCVAGKGGFSARNAMGANVAFCQTVLPGNEAMLITTNVEAGAVAGLAVPGTDYWAGTAAHYYINPAGVSPSQGCVWGDNSSPWGNWAPYVAGANMDGSGTTFVKVGWNPIYTDDAKWNTVLPTWAVAIECTGGGCVGLPCRCDPRDGINVCSGGSSGAGGAAFCVATIPPGSSANVVVYDSAAGMSGAAQIKAVQNFPTTPTTTTTPTPTPTPTTTTTPPPAPTTTTPPPITTTTPPPTPTTTSTPPPPPTITWTPLPSSSSTSSSNSSTFIPSSSTSRNTTNSGFQFAAFPTAFAFNTTTSSLRALNTSISSRSSSWSFSNATTSTSIISTIPTPTFLRGGAGYDNLQAAQASPTATTTSSGTLLELSPVLMFLGALVVLARL